MLQLNIRISLLSLLVSFTFLTYSQDKVHFDTASITNRLGVGIINGTIVPHENALKPLVNHAVRAFELSYSIIKIDRNTWHSYYNYPEVGISYMLMDFGYKNVLGQSHSFYPYAIFPITKHDKRLNLSLKVALGLSYINKIYDSISNPANIAISAPINMYASLSVIVNYRLSSKISANIGINAFHFSNGSIKKPNYGLNILTGSLGINYNLNHSSINQYSHTEQVIDSPRWLVILAGGVKETKAPGGLKYGVGSISFEYSRSSGMFLRYGTTLDYMYDGSTLAHFREDSVRYKYRIKASKIGLALLGEMSLYRLSAFGNLGFYLYNHDKQVSFIYQRVGLRYRLAKSMYVQGSLKTHLNVADYLEFGAIYRLK